MPKPAKSTNENNGFPGIKIHTYLPNRIFMNKFLSVLFPVLSLSGLAQTFPKKYVDSLTAGRGIAPKDIQQNFSTLLYPQTNRTGNRLRIIVKL